MPIDMKNLLPKLMQKDFWRDFLDVVSEELQNIKDEIAKKELFYDTRVQTDSEHLVDLAKTFGYVTDRSLHENDIDHLRRDVASIPFRIKYKSTYLSYFHIFKFTPYNGEVFLLFWNTVKLVRAYDADNMINIVTHDPSTPFQFQSELNYVSFLFTALYLDFTPVLELDSTGFPWFLDQDIARVSTKHKAIEYVMDKLLQQDGDQTYYGTLNIYMQYLLTTVLYNKECTEVPHCGIQVTGIMDDSELFDNGMHNEAIFKGTTNIVANPRDLTGGAWNDQLTTRLLSTTEQAEDFFMSKITKTSTINNCYVYQNISITDTEIPFQMILRRGDSDLSRITLYDTVAATNHIELTVDWTTDTITLITGTFLRYEWLDSDTVWVSGISTTLNPANNQQLRIYPTYYSGDSGAFIYVACPQLENYDYPTPFVVRTQIRTDVIHSFAFTLPSQFSFKLKLKKAWFNYDTTTDKYMFSWRVDIDSYFVLVYIQTADRFQLKWIDNGTVRILTSQQFDDGSSWDDVNQDNIIIFGSVDFTTGDTTGSRLIVITNEQTFEDTIWSGNIDAMTSSFTTLEIGSWNSGNGFADSQISYLYIYDGTTAGTITDEDSLDTLLEGKAILFQRDFSTYEYGADYYSIPNIKLKATRLPDFNPTNIITQMVVGTGSQLLPGKYNSGVAYPTALANQIQDQNFHSDQRNTTDPDHYLFIGRFQGNTIQNEIIDVGDGTNNFSGTLNYFPVEPKIIKIEYTSGFATYEVEDLKGTGQLEGAGAEGTIDYETGDWTLDTQVIKTAVNELVYSGSILNLNEFLDNPPLIAGTLRVKYRVGGTLYVAVDDGLGNVSGTYITTGTINYTTGQLIITFSTTTDVGESINADYSYTKTTTPDLGTDIIVTVYSIPGNQADITEAGLIDEYGDLVAYMSFPPLRFGSRKFHGSFQFFIKKGTFE